MENACEETRHGGRKTLVLSEVLRPLVAVCHEELVLYKRRSPRRRTGEELAEDDAECPDVALEEVVATFVSAVRKTFYDGVDVSERGRSEEGRNSPGAM